MIETQRIVKAMKEYNRLYDETRPVDEFIYEEIVKDIYSPNKDPFFLAEVELIEEMNRNSHLIQLYKSCRTVLTELAQDIKTEHLQKELFEHILDLGLDRMQLYHGNMLFFHALRTSPEMHTPEQIENYVELFNEAPAIHSLSNLTVYSIIIRLYVALVYMRGDRVREALNKNTPAQAHHINKAKSLFNHEIIRHLRNSLAHGHIHPALTGLYFKDRNFEIIIPLKFSEDIGRVLYAFYFHAFDNINLRLFPHLKPPDV